MENSPSVRFCVACGAPLGHVCLLCGFQNSPESNFCGGCGIRLQEAQLEGVGGERRQLTVPAVLAPEIWRIRGRLLARHGDPGAEPAYREAIDRARIQQALSLELRAALDLCELRAGRGRDEEARNVLAGVLRRFPPRLDRGEPARDAALLGGERELL